MPSGGIPAVVGPGDVFALLDDAQARTEGADDSIVSRLYTNFVHERTCSDPAALDVFWDSVEGDLALGLHAVLAIDYEWGVALQGGGRTPSRLDSLGAGGEGDADVDADPGVGVGVDADADADADADYGPQPDAGPDLDHVLSTNAAKGERNRIRIREGADQGAFRVLLFRDLHFLSEQQVLGWLVQAEARALDVAPSTLAAPAPAGIADVQHSVTASQFEHAIAQIHAALARGDCYQINYTFRLTFGVFGHPLSLYRRVRERQPASYGALISTARGWSLSASPELFLRHRSGQLLAQPMKGTAVRDSDPVIDAACGATLQSDPKNRAENVMIVDLLRNDLSKLATPGGVRVDNLFAVRAWPTVWQMTSDVAATLKPNIRFPDVLRALYPCGSITGAPKHAAIALIRELESTPRGLYTGAIGWFDRFTGGDGREPTTADSDADTQAHVGVQVDPSSPTHRCGDFCLSVAIRTVTIPTRGLAVALDDADTQGSEARLTRGGAGIGAGIVLDSDAASEHDECLLKSRFLTEADPGFALIETLLAEDLYPMTNVAGATARHYLPLRARHLRRLVASSTRLGFRCDLVAVHAALDGALLSIVTPGPHRIRLTLSKRGEIDCGAWPMQPLRRDARAGGARTGVAGALDAPGATGAVTILLASDYGFGPIGTASSADAFLLGFKTTHRADYDRAWQQAETLGAFDMIFANAAGHMTEGGRSNLLVKLDGAWFTPAASSGLLAGVMRGALMDDPDWAVRERHLTLSDLARAESLVVCNALRGAVPAILRRASDMLPTSPAS